MTARTGRLILQGMILLAALTWLAALALAEPAAGQSGAGQRSGQNQNVAAVAAQVRAQKAAQGSPFAGAEDERLGIWTGAWEETVRFAGDPEGKPSGSGKWLARPFYGLYVVTNYELKGPEGNYRAHAVMAYDHGLKTYRLWWFDDGANVNEYTGDWKDDNTLVFEMKRTTGGKVFRERITYSKASADEVHTKIEQAFGTEPFKLYLESNAHRIAMPEGQGERNPLRQQQQQQPPRKQPPGF